MDEASFLGEFRRCALKNSRRSIFPGPCYAMHHTLMTVLARKTPSIFIITIKVKVLRNELCFDDAR